VVPVPSVVRPCCRAGGPALEAENIGDHTAQKPMCWRADAALDYSDRDIDAKIAGVARMCDLAQRDDDWNSRKRQRAV